MGEKSELLTKHCDVIVSTSHLRLEPIPINNCVANLGWDQFAFSDKRLHQIDMFLLLFYYSTVSAPLRFAL